MILELTQEELECLAHTVTRVLNWEAPMALQAEDLEDPVYCIARDNYLEAKTGILALRRAQ